jgi:5-formyltetrahydrofolate cyclo-ligase
MILQYKKIIRKKILAERDSFVASENYAEKMIASFKERVNVTAESIIAAYYPSGSEINILPLLEYLSNKGYKIALPVIKEGIKFYAWKPGDKMVSSQYSKKILEPINQEFELLPTIVIAPLIACDHLGNRIGSGKAMYDSAIKSLRQANPNLLYIGICYHFQVLDNILVQEHDQKLDLIIQV